MKRNERGITLIALVVTIVVLLILAGVSISMLTGENGIITQAQQSKLQTEIGKEKEYITLSIASIKSDKLSRGDTSEITSSELQTEMNKYTNEATVTGTRTLRVTYESGRSYEVDQNGNVTQKDELEETAEDFFTFDEETGTITGIVENTSKDPNGVGFYYQDLQGFSSETNIVIPETINGVEVKIIGRYAFQNATNVESIIIPNSVTTIKTRAFDDCTGLTSITIPDSVTTIENDVFYSCSSLTSITIPNSVTTIEHRTFYNCSSLTNITIPESVTSIESSAFSGCTSLTSITIPDSVTTIEDDVFYSCSSLTSITIPESVTSIGISAFSGCSSLTSITIPNSVTTIGYEAFYNCSSLTNITIPESVTSISWDTFYNCTSLTSITIPNSVTYIGSEAFYNCSKLTTVNYKGTEEEWNQIRISSGNEALTNAEIKYNQ